jgi:hypothetical protein
MGALGTGKTEDIDTKVHFHTKKTHTNKDQTVVLL